MPRTIFIPCVYIILAVLLGACALGDLTPDTGWPDTIETTTDLVDFVPSDNFDFHNNPQL